MKFKLGEKVMIDPEHGPTYPATTRQCAGNEALLYQKITVEQVFVVTGANSNNYYCLDSLDGKYQLAAFEYMLLPATETAKALFV